MAIYYWYDQPYTRTITWPYRKDDNTTGTYDTQHCCYINGHSSAITWPGPEPAYDAIGMMETIAALLLPVWWDTFGITAGVFPQQDVGGRNGTITW